MPDLHRVTMVQQRGDNTVVVYVQTDSFKPGEEVEVSVYLTQGNAYAAFNGTKRIPYPDLNNPKQPTVLHVELPVTKLKADRDVTVVTRVTEVWSSVLQKDSKIMERYKEIIKENFDQELKAVWTYQDSEGKGSGDT